MKTASALISVAAALLQFGSFVLVEADTPAPLTPTPEYSECQQANAIGDGGCQLENNVEACGFDGGDCCECDCQEGNSGYDCGQLGFACVDPSSTCVDDDDYIEGACGNRDDMGNGRCDLENNVEGCGFDGGDCCECDCEDSVYSCNDTNFFACADPDSACIDDNPYVVGACGDIETVEDGKCDTDNNVAGCWYDGGDCCECDCVLRHLCHPDYDCIDPNSACVSDESAGSTTHVVVIPVVASLSLMIVLGELFL